MDESLPLQIKWRGNLYSFTCNKDDTLLSLKLKLEEETHVLVDKQKITMRFNPKPESPNDAPLSTVVMPKNKTFMMVGTPEEDLFVAPSEEEQLKLLPVELQRAEGPLADQYRPVNLAKVESRKKSFKLKILNEPRPGKKLLVLDIDYTLFDHRSAAERPAELMRPYLHEFLTAVYEHYDIIIWSATSMKWIELKMTQLGVMSHPDYKIVCFFDYSAMITLKSDHYGVVNVKPLAVVWHFFPENYDEHTTIMFDDIRRNFLMNPQNGLRIAPFKNAAQLRDTDKELLGLRDYLLKIAPLDSFSLLDHKVSNRNPFDSLIAYDKRFTEMEEILSLLALNK